MLRHRCDTARNTALGTNGRHIPTPHLTGVRCAFMPMSAEAAVRNGFDVGFGWYVYAASSADILIGDRLTWNGETYIVKGKKPYLQFGGTSHIEFTAETEHANGQ